MVITSFEQLDLTKQYTYADYLAWQIEERLELIKGWVMRMASPSVAHQTVSQRVNLNLMLFFGTNDCRVFAAPFDVRFPNQVQSAKTAQNAYTVVQPDLCVICDIKKLDTRGCVGAPDLVVEILSPGNTKKEMKQKYELYQEEGVKEYWIIHPNEKYAVVHTLNNEQKFVASPYFTDDDMLQSLVFPELKIELKNVFQNV
jgi:Uma2 family endonuclease